MNSFTVFLDLKTLGFFCENLVIQIGRLLLLSNGLTFKCRNFDRVICSDEVACCFVAVCFVVFVVSVGVVVFVIFFFYLDFKK